MLCQRLMLFTAHPGPLTNLNEEVRPSSLLTCRHRRREEELTLGEGGLYDIARSLGEEQLAL